MPRRELVLIALVTAPFVMAQPPGPELKFEVASIKRNTTDIPISVGLELRHGRLAGTTIRLPDMIATADGLSAPRIIGPAWLDTERFDVLAKSPDGIPDTELKAMLQSLLKERFQLAVHRETQEKSICDLVIGKNGIKMHVYPAPTPPAIPAYPRGTPTMAGRFTMGQLADVLSQMTGTPVIDKTGLPEQYELALSFAPLSPRLGDSPDNYAGVPDVFIAIQEQLGLKLEAKKAPVEVIVVDHVERLPSEN